MIGFMLGMRCPFCVFYLGLILSLCVRSVTDVIRFIFAISLGAEIRAELYLEATVIFVTSGSHQSRSVVAHRWRHGSVHRWRCCSIRLDGAVVTAGLVVQASPVPHRVYVASSSASWPVPRVLSEQRVLCSFIPQLYNVYSHSFQS